MNDQAATTVLLSIVIPVYNRQQGLLELLKSLTEDSEQAILPKIEVIVIDDGSTIPLEILASKFKITLFRSPQNSGAPKARETGFLMSQGSFVHFHDSDDAFDKGWLTALIKELEAFPEVDILLTARHDISQTGSRYRYQKFFHRHVDQVDRIKKRLIYRNCMGPLGGVTFSRRLLWQVEFMKFSSCQDWQMYLGAIEHAKFLKSCPQISYRFNIAGDDRISHHPGKKLLGHMQLSRLTAQKSVFHKNIRLFYLMTCKHHIMNKKGQILAFYRKNRFIIWVYYILASVYWRFN